MDKILLIDAHNFIWRGMVFYNTINAPKDIIMVFNFFKNFRAIVEQFKPNKIFMAWEGHPKFRYDLFADYKANRIIKTASKQENNEIFNKSKHTIKNLLSKLPVTSARSENYEADDVIATLCEQMKDEELTIVSSDTDYIQLLQKNYKNINLYNPIKKQSIEAPPYPYTIWKSFVGDKSDNIPKILSENKTIKLLSNPEELDSFLSIEENRANFSINLKLIEFANIPDEELIIEDGVVDFIEIKKSFIEMEFNTILSKWSNFKSTFDCVTI